MFLLAAAATSTEAAAHTARPTVISPSHLDAFRLSRAAGGARPLSAINEVLGLPATRRSAVDHQIVNDARLEVLHVALSVLKVPKQELYDGSPLDGSSLVGACM